MGPKPAVGQPRGDVIISDSPIRFPKVTGVNLLVCLTQQAYSRFITIVRPGGLVLTDSRYVKVESAVDARQVQLPLYRSVVQQTGSPLALNVCMLGAVLARVS
ncbi:2-oxoacid:acceptor oxidoreductase family protein [Thermodesulfobacteriota bacterium]